MINLEILELHAEWPGAQYEPTPFDGNLPILSRLRFAKLFGYIPQDFARYVILGSALTLERLELGLLDRPVSQYWRKNQGANCPLPSERVDRGMSVDHRFSQSVGADGEVEDSGDFDRDNEDDGDHSSNADSNGNSDRNSSADYGSLNGEDSETLDYLAPRPLGVLIPNASSSASGSGRQLFVTFPKLKHLYLCKPVEGEVGNSIYQVLYSSRARMACACDWSLLLCGAKEMLETLVLEHRTCVVAPEEIFVPSAHMIKHYSDGWDESYFVDMIVPILFSERGGFERLRRISLYGIFVGENSSMKERNELVALCQRKNIQCEGHIGTICEFQIHNGLSWWVNRGDDDEEEQDDDSELFFCEPLERSKIIWKA